MEVLILMYIFDVSLIVYIIVSIVKSEIKRRKMGSVLVPVTMNIKDVCTHDIIFMIIVSGFVCKDFIEGVFEITNLLFLVSFMLFFLYAIFIKKSIRENGIVYYANLILWKEIENYEWEDVNSIEMDNKKKFCRLKIKKKGIINSVIKLNICKELKDEVNSILLEKV